MSSYPYKLNHSDAIKIRKVGDNLSHWIGTAYHYWWIGRKGSTGLVPQKPIDMVFLFDNLSRSFSTMLKRPDVKSGLSRKPNTVFNLPSDVPLDSGVPSIDSVLANLVDHSVKQSQPDGIPFDVQFAVATTRAMLVDETLFEGNQRSSFDILIDVSNGNHPELPYHGIIEPWT